MLIVILIRPTLDPHLCSDWADLVEAIERTEPAQRDTTIQAWLRVVGPDQRLVRMIMQASAYVRAGMTASQAWQECPTI